MNHSKKKLPRRYKLNKKRFAATLLILGCTAMIIVVVVESLVNAVDAGVVDARAMVDTDDKVWESDISSPPLESTLASQKPITPKAEGLLILVNWDNPVPYDRPDNLVMLSEVFGDEVICVNTDGSINAEAGAMAKEMFLAAQAEGIGKYELSSAYRSIVYQDTLWQARIAEDTDYGSNPYENPVKVMPGKMSEHTTGLALDILAESYESSDEGYADTPEGIWLAENACKFGFILRYPKDKENITGVIFEPWHYRYVGKEAAREIFKRSICLEEYLGVAESTS